MRRLFTRRLFVFVFSACLFIYFSSLLFVDFYQIRFAKNLFSIDDNDESIDRKFNENAKRLAKSSSDMTIIDDDSRRPAINRTPGYVYYDNQALSWQNNVYLERYRLHYCKIDKNMGSAMQAILCYIDQPKHMAEFFWNRTWGPGLGGDNDCGTSTSYGDLRNRFLKAAERPDFFDPKNNILHYTIIRHPIRRFVSAFINICLQSQPLTCNNCSTLECFLPKLYDQMRRHAEHATLSRWEREHHFYPQSWYCDFDRRYDAYRFVRYDRNGAFIDELLQMLTEVGVNKHRIKDIATVITRKSVLHDTHEHAPRILDELAKSPKLLAYIYKIYYLDFVWFGYDLTRNSWM